MQEFDNKTVRSRMNRYSMPIVALVVVLIGGAGFAATGGIQAAKALFIKVQLQGDDGTVYEGVIETVQGAPGDGPAQLQFETEDGSVAKVTVQRTADPAGGSEQKQISVQLDGDVAQAKTMTLQAGDASAAKTITLQAAGSRTAVVEGIEGAGEAGARELTVQMEALGGDAEATALVAAAPYSVAEAIAEPLEVFQWEEADGTLREISIVQNGADDPLGDGLRVFSTLPDGRYAEVATVLGISTDGIAVDDLSLTDEGLATITLHGPGGKMIELRVDPSPTMGRAAEPGAAKRMFLRRPTPQE